MPEKELKFGPSKEERPEISLERWAEAQALDFIIQRTRVRRLKMEDKVFVDRYGAGTIAEDRSKVERTKALFKARSERLPAQEQIRYRLSLKRGEALEIIIAEQGELSEWFGPNAMTERTTEFDDILNKVDLVVEFAPETDEAAEKNMSRIAFAIDASDSLSGIAKKMAVNKARITGKLPSSSVKYFRSQVTGYNGPLKRIIPVVVGLEGKNMADLVRLQHESLRAKVPRATHEQLAKHPAQRVFIEQILLQLRWYLKLLEQEKIAHPTYGKEDINGLLRVMEGLLKDKKSIPLGELGEDMVRQEIQNIVE